MGKPLNHTTVNGKLNGQTNHEEKPKSGTWRIAGHRLNDLGGSPLSKGWHPADRGSDRWPMAIGAKCEPHN